MSKLAFRAQTVDIAYLPLRQDLLSKNALMTAQRDFCLGNMPLPLGTSLIRNQPCYLSPIGFIKEGWFSEIPLPLGGLFGHNVTPIGLVSQEPSPTGSLKAFECSLIGFQFWHDELNSAIGTLEWWNDGFRGI
jgi:hypothetical protein